MGVVGGCCWFFPLSSNMQAYLICTWEGFYGSVVDYLLQIERAYWKFAPYFNRRTSLDFSVVKCLIQV